MPRITKSNGKDQGQPGLFGAEGKADTARLKEETEQLLINTKRFLEQLQSGEEATRRYVEGLKATLENDLRRLERDRREAKKRPS